MLGLGFRVLGLSEAFDGLRVQGLGFRVYRLIIWQFAGSPFSSSLWNGLWGFWGLKPQGRARCLGRLRALRAPNRTVLIRFLSPASPLSGFRV